jgi:hypothetical protein
VLNQDNEFGIFVVVVDNFNKLWKVPAVPFSKETSQ